MPKTFQQPDNDNYLSPAGFKFTIKHLPNVQWFIQSVNLPGLTLNEVIQPTPLLDTSIPGEKVTFEPLNIGFVVDENMENWKEIYEWMIGLTSPENYEQYKNLKDSSLTTGFGGRRDSIYSDATLVILNSNMRATHQILFKELFPLNLSSINFSTIVGDIDYITADVSFAFTNYSCEKI